MALHYYDDVIVGIGLHAVPALLLVQRAWHVACIIYYFFSKRQCILVCGPIWRGEPARAGQCMAGGGCAKATMSLFFGGLDYHAVLTCLCAFFAVSVLLNMANLFKNVAATINSSIFRVYLSYISLRTFQS